MDRLARFVVKFPRLVVATLLLISTGLGVELRGLNLEVKLSDLVPANHPYVKIDHRLAARLGVHQTAILAIRPRRGDVFQPFVLTAIRRLTTGIERMPGVIPSSVLSLTARRAKEVSGDAEGIFVRPLVGDSIPTDGESLAKLRQRVMALPMYIGTLVTPDGRGAMVLADFRDHISTEKITARLNRLAAKVRSPRIEVYVGGQPVALAAVDNETRSIASLVLLALLVVAVVHYEAFRTLQAVFLPLLTAVLSVVWAMGLTALFGYRLTPWTAITSVLVLAVAAGHAVQVLKRYYECYRETGDNREAVRLSLIRVGPVMVIACCVASAGFFSLATFGIPAVQDFGIMAGLGILSAMVLELSFIPAMRVLLRDPRVPSGEGGEVGGLLGKTLDGLSAAVLRSPGIVLLIVFVAVVGVALGIPRIEVNTSFRSWFAKDTPAIKADRIIRRDFTGTSTIRILIEGDAPDALLDPRVLAGMGDLQRALSKDPGVTATLSLADYVKVMNRAMNGGAPAAYQIPDSRNLVAQYMLLFGTGDLSRVVSPDFMTGEVLALARRDRVSWVEGLFRKLRRVAAASFPPDVRVEVAGGELGDSAAANESVVREKIENIAQISLVIFVLAALTFRSGLVGMLVIAPLAIAAAVNLGVMGWVGTWLSFATASYTALGVSLGADFAIYLLFRLREEARVLPLPEATARAMRTSGRAIVFVASAIAAGNAALLASDFQLWRQLGGYMGLMMVTSCVATLTVIPALVLLVSPRALVNARSNEEKGMRSGAVPNRVKEEVTRIGGDAG